MNSNYWYIYALVAMFCYACMALTLKRLSFELDTHTTLLYLFSITSLLFLFYSFSQNTNYKVHFPIFLLLVLASVFAFLGNYFDLKALTFAPNAGYAAAIKGGQIIIIVVGALYFFKGQSITFTGGVGVALILVGIVLLSTQST